MKKIGCLIGVLLLLGLVYILYEVLAIGKFPTIWHQKVSLTVATPSGNVSGSSVTQMKIVPSGALTGDGRRSNTYLEGEAVVVDLGATPAGPRYLFALLKRFRKPASGEPVEISPKNYPLLVTFDDINDPASVKRVAPANLAASFGPGYVLKSITLEITDEPVTEGRVEEVLGWLSNVWPNRLDGQRYETIKAENRFANSLSTGSFTTESFK